MHPLSGWDGARGAALRNSTVRARRAEPVRGADGAVALAAPELRARLLRQCAASVVGSTFKPAMWMLSSCACVGDVLCWWRLMASRRMASRVSARTC